MDNTLLQQALQRIEALEKEVQNLKISSAIPLDIERSFENRGFIERLSIDEIDPTIYDSLNTLVPVDGSGVGDIPLLAFPIRWIKLTRTFEAGGNFYIPAYTLFN